MKILCVCGFGCGSSMVLKTTLDKVCKKRGLDIETEIADMNTATGINCDAIFTSAELGEQLKSSSKVPIYPLKRYMSLEEVGEALDKCLGDIS